MKIQVVKPGFMTPFSTVPYGAVFQENDEYYIAVHLDCGGEEAVLGANLSTGRLVEFSDQDNVLVLNNATVTIS